MLLRVLGLGVWLCLGALAEDALPRLLEQFRSTPKNAALCDRIGIAYVRTGELAAAEGFFRNALQLDPGLLSARKNLGTVLWFQNRRSESELVFQRVAKSAPADPVANLYLGLAGYERKQFERAAEHFKAAGTLASANPEVRPFLIETYLNSGRPGEAIRVLEPALANGQGDEKSWLQLGQAYDRANRAQDAYRAFQKAIELQPVSEEGYLLLADFAAAHGNRKFARETLHQAMRANPGSATLTLQYGVQSALEGDFEDAARSFSAARQLAPQAAVPVLALGVAQLQAGRLDEAAESFRAASKLDGNDFRSPLLYATALGQSSASGDQITKDRIKAALMRAIALSPRHPGARVALAQQLVAEGRLDAARTELKTALDLDSTNTAALYQLARVYQRQGKAAEAESTMQRFRQAKAPAREEENQLIQILKTVK